MEFLQWVQRYFSVYYLQQNNASQNADRIQCGDCILSNYLMLLIEYPLQPITKTLRMFSRIRKSMPGCNWAITCRNTAQSHHDFLQC
jgi:hypothetical protein